MLYITQNTNYEKRLSSLILQIDSLIYTLFPIYVVVVYSYSLLYSHSLAPVTSWAEFHIWDKGRDWANIYVYSRSLLYSHCCAPVFYIWGQNYIFAFIWDKGRDWAVAPGPKMRQNSSSINPPVARSRRICWGGSGAIPKNFLASTCSRRVKKMKRLILKNYNKKWSCLSCFFCSNWQ